MLGDIFQKFEELKFEHFMVDMFYHEYNDFSKMWGDRIAAGVDSGESLSTQDYDKESSDHSNKSG